MELPLVIFIDRDEVVVVAEFLNSWEVSVLLVIDFATTRIRVSVLELVSLLPKTILSLFVLGALLIAGFFALRFL